MSSSSASFRSPATGRPDDKFYLDCFSRLPEPMPCFTARRGVACCPGIARSRIIKPRNTARSNSLEHDAAVVIGCIGDTSYRVSPMRGRSIRRAHGRGPAPDTHRARLDVSISGHRLTPGRAGLSELPHFDRRPAGPVCGRLSAGGRWIRTSSTARIDSISMSGEECAGRPAAEARVYPLWNECFATREGGLSR